MTPLFNDVGRNAAFGVNSGCRRDATMFSKCILHIGTEKTGTTTLQRFLTNNRQVLRESGWLFPSQLGVLSNRFIFTHAMDDDRSDETRDRLGIATADDLKRHRQHVEEILNEEATGAEESVLLLSSEHCHSRLIRHSEVSRLQSLLSRYCRQVSVIVYLRPQHELAISLYSTALRVGYSGRPLLPEVTSDMAYYNYQHLLDRWAAVFGEANVIPRIFSRKELLQGDICADFLQLCGIDGRALIHTPDTNRTLSGEAQAFLERINPFLPAPQRNTLVRMLENIGSAPGATPSRNQAKQFFAIFADSNEAVRRRWFPERYHLFNVDFSTYPKQPVVPTLREEEAFALFASLWRERQRQDQPKKPRN